MAPSMIRAKIIGIAFFVMSAIPLCSFAARTNARSDEKLQNEIDSINLQMDFLKLKVSDTNKKTRIIENNIKKKRDEINQLQKQVDQLSLQQIEISRQIDDMENQIKLEKTEMHAMLERYRSRLVQLHRIRQGTLLGSVFSAQSLNAFLNRYEMVKYLLQNDKQVLQKLKQKNFQQRKLSMKLSQKKQQLENGKTELAIKTQKLTNENKALKAMLSTVLLEKKLLLNKEKSLAVARTQLEKEFARIEKLHKEQTLDKELADTPASLPAPKLGGELSNDASNAARIMDFSWPVSREKRKNLRQIERANSASLQIYIDQDTEIYASARGKVLYKGTISGLGNVIIIGHQRGFSTVYARLDDIWVGLGEVVEQKATIGKKSGGKSTNMHFEIRFGGRKQKPLDFLPESG